MTKASFDIDRFIEDTTREKMPEGSVENEALRLIHRLGSSTRWKYTCETGTGRTTVLLSNLSENHVVFALERSENLQAGGRRAERTTGVQYVLGPSQKTLPAFSFAGNLDFALIDGPHAYPFPDMEYYHLYPLVKEGGWLVVDDVHIPTINNLFRFLCEEPMWRFHARVGNTAFFQRTTVPTFDPIGDSWWVQTYNLNHIHDHKAWTVKLKMMFRRALGLD